MRRIATLAAATLTAGALAVVPQANAQTEALQLISLANQNIATLDCGVVDTVLTQLDLVDDTTTHGQLVTKLNGIVGNDLTLRLISSGTVNAIADRALECGVVKPNPTVDPLTALLTSSQNGSSNLDVLPLLNQLSSLSS